MQKRPTIRVLGGAEGDGGEHGAIAPLGDEDERKGLDEHSNPPLLVARIQKESHDQQKFSDDGNGVMTGASTYRECISSCGDSSAGARADWLLIAMSHLLPVSFLHNLLSLLHLVAVLLASSRGLERRLRTERGRDIGARSVCGERRESALWRRGTFSVRVLPCTSRQPAQRFEMIAGLIRVEHV